MCGIGRNSPLLLPCNVCDGPIETSVVFLSTVPNQVREGHLADEPALNLNLFICIFFSTVSGTFFFSSSPSEYIF